MQIGPAVTYSNLEEEVSQNIAEMHHNEAPNDPVRYRGLARDAKVAFLGFEGSTDRLQAYLQKMPAGTKVLVGEKAALPQGSNK